MYENLKKLRESLNLTQAEFGKSVGVAKSTYNNYEIGVREPKSDFWIAVAKKYNVTIDYLMGYTNNQYAAPIAQSSPAAFPFAPVDLLVARAYHNADDGTQAAIRKLLDVSDTPEIDREVMSYRRELEDELQGEDAASASPDVKMA